MKSLSPLFCRPRGVTLGFGLHTHTHTHTRRIIFALLLFACASYSQDAFSFDHCFEHAGLRYNVAPRLLRAIAEQESSMNPRATNRNRDGSVDVGLMQINSRWLPFLSRYGIVANDLWDPCTSIMIGAWVLGTNFKTMGVNIKALGAYNSSNPLQRERYALQVLARLKKRQVSYAN